jgi:sugar transferase EpsL
MKALLKRLFDLLVSSILLTLMSPLLGLLALAIVIKMRRPIFFRQLRPGHKTKPFILLKFRTMTNVLDARGRLLPDAERLTGLGKLMRRLSLDELPQLWNVWKGDMSLVGPRPLLMQYLDRYTAEQMRRHDVKPGITGWAQVKGRNSLSWPEKFALDTWYVDHWNLPLDLRIILMTIRQLISGSETSQRGHATMPEFDANQQGQP